MPPLPPPAAGRRARVRGVAAAVLAAVAPVLAADPPPVGQTAMTNVPSVTVAGTALSAGGEPLAGVRVILAAADGTLFGERTRTVVAESTTGPDGRFAFAGLPPLSEVPAGFDPRSPDRPDGRWGYAAAGVKAGLATAFASYQVPYPPTDPLPDPAGLELTMPPAVPLSGAVVTDGGAPIAGARVSLGYNPKPPGPGPLANLQAAVTGADGGFTITDLAAWDDRESMVRSSPRTWSSSPKRFSVTADGYSPGRFEVRSIPPEEFPRVELSRAGGLTGLVIDTVTGEPAAGVRVGAQSTTYPVRPDGTPDFGRMNEVNGWGEAVTDASGRYAISPLPPTTYNLLPLGVPPSRAAAALTAVPVAPGAPTEAGPVRLVRGGVLRGRFLNADGEPIARASYRRDDSFGGDPPADPPEWTDLSVGLHGPSRPKLLGAAVESAEVGPDGRFEFRVPPGRQFPYMMSGSAAAEWVPEPWMESGVVVGPGETIEITFRVQGAGPNPGPPDGLTFPEPAEADREAAKAVRGYGGFYDLDENGRVVAVDFVSHAPPPGADAAKLKLERGEVYNPRKILGGAGPYVAALQELKTLRFWRKQFGDDDLAAVGLSPSLEEVSAVYLTEGTVTDAGMAGLARAKTLKVVRFREAGLTDASLKAFGTVPGLTDLGLDGNVVTDEGVKALAGLKGLETLLLGARRPDPRVGGPVFQDARGVTDAGATALLGLKNLRTLDIQGTSVTDAFLDALADDPAALPRLDRLFMAQSETTAAGRARLRAARPGLTVNLSACGTGSSAGDVSRPRLTAGRPRAAARTCAGSAAPAGR